MMKRVSDTVSNSAHILLTSEMAPRRPSKLLDHIELTITKPRQDANADDERPANKLADTLSDKLFKKDSLDRKLERHQITGNRYRVAFE